MKRFIFCIGVTMLLISIGCSPIPVQSETSTVARVVAIEAFTLTPIPLPPSVTPTLRSTPFLKPQTLTPFPTLTTDQLKTKLFDLLLDNGECKLPCIVGYTSGISTREDIRVFFNQLRARETSDISISRHESDDVSDKGFFLRLSDNYLNMGISAYGNQEQVEVLKMDAFSQPNWDPQYAKIMKYYSLPQILTNYGMPSQVLILTYRNDRQRPDVTVFPFYLVLLYSDRGFFLEYEMNRETKGDEFLGCPAKSSVSITAWSPQTNKTFEKATHGTRLGLYPDEYKSIEDATSMTLDEFFLTFMGANNTSCIETPIETWPNP